MCLDADLLLTQLLPSQIVLNAALGFDTYLVMRHGAAPDESTSTEAESSKAPHERRLGCYFCNDIVAPADVSMSAFCKRKLLLTIRVISL